MISSSSVSYTHNFEGKICIHTDRKMFPDQLEGWTYTELCEYQGGSGTDGSADRL